METKPGIYTTEFWLTVLVNIAAIVSASADVLPAHWAGIISTVVTGAYAIARGIAKAGNYPDPTVKANAKLVPTSKDMKHDSAVTVPTPPKP